MRIDANREVCTGAGNCVMTAPEVFNQDDDMGLVRLLTQQPPDPTYELVRRAAAMCPSGAITITE